MMGFVCPKGHKGVSVCTVDAQKNVIIFYCKRCEKYYHLKLGDN